MKILCIIQCSNLGGMEQAQLKSLMILKEQGHEVSLFSLQPVGALKNLTDAAGISLVGTNRYRLMGLANIAEMLRIIQQIKPDRLWLSGHNFATLIAARMSSVPTFLSIHYHHSERSFVFWRLFYGLAKLCTRNIHFVSQYIFDEVSVLFKPPCKYTIFTNVFKESSHHLPKKEARQVLELPQDRFVVGNAGWLIKRKAFDVFLNTASLVLKEVPQALFVIAGDGEERDALETQANELNIKDSVRFIGWQNNLEPFYASIDTLLFNSLFDALGRSPIEALCNGVPLVASVTHGGLKEFIRHGVDGFLIEQHDCEQLAQEIIRIYKNPELAEEMALRGKEHVLRMGSAEKHIEYLNAFLELK